MRLIPILMLAALTACSGGAPAPAENTEPAANTEAAGDEAGGPSEGEADADATAAEGEQAAAEGEGEGADMPDMAKLEEARGKVHAMMGKDDAKAAVVAILGEPATASETEMVWMGKDGETCKALKVQIMGDFTGGVTVEDTDCAAGEADAAE